MIATFEFPDAPVQTFASIPSYLEFCFFPSTVLTVSRMLNDRVGIWTGQGIPMTIEDGEPLHVGYLYKHNAMFGAPVSTLTLPRTWPDSLRAPKYELARLRALIDPLAATVQLIAKASADDAGLLFHIGKLWGG